jgi:hypothetical protein
MPIAVVALVLLLSQVSPNQQQKGDYAFWPEMPEAARVIKDVQGSNELDTAARQLAASRLLFALVAANADRVGRLPWPPREQELYHAYAGLEYESQRPNESGPRDQQIQAQSFHYQADRAFTRPLLARYFSPAALREMEPIVSGVEANAQSQIKLEEPSLATTAPAADSTPGPWALVLKEWGPFLRSFMLSTVGLLILTLIFSLREVSGPHLKADSKDALRLPDSLRRIRVFRKGYDACCQSGKIFDKELWTETNVTTTTSGGGTYRTGDTISTTPITTSTNVNTTVYHRYWLRSPDGREFWRRFSGGEFSATTGQVISTIDSGSDVLIAYNHSTGQFATRRNWLSKLHNLHKMRWGGSIFFGIALVGYLWNIGIVRAHLANSSLGIVNAQVGSFLTMFGMCIGVTFWMAAMFFAWGIPIAILNAIIRTTRNRQFEKRFVPAFRHFLEESTPELLARFRVLPT